MQTPKYARLYSSVFEQFLCYFFAKCDSDEHTHIYIYICVCVYYQPYIYIYIYMVGNCCLSLYFNIAGLRQGHGMLLGSWKVLEFFVTKRAGTVLILNVVRFLVSSRDWLFFLLWVMFIEILFLVLNAFNSRICAVVRFEIGISRWKLQPHIYFWYKPG